MTHKGVFHLAAFRLISDKTCPYLCSRYAPGRCRVWTCPMHYDKDGCFSDDCQKWFLIRTVQGYETDR